MRILLLLAGLAMVSVRAGEDLPDTALKHSPCYISRVNLIGAKELQALARREQALVFLNSAVCNPAFMVLLGPENKRDKDAKLPVFDSAQERKDRSDARLKILGVPVLPSLPPVIGDEELSPRTAKEAVRRCVALAVVAAHAEGLEPGQAAGMLKKWSLEDALSPKEKDFLAKQAPTKQERIQFTWRYECVYVLLWALKQKRDLGTPGKPNDAAEIVKKALALTEAGAMDKLELRSAAELLDATDFVYRCHWATTDARVKKKDPPEALDPGVVLEWHHVLNWLIRHEDAEWDNVNTDT